MNTPAREILKCLCIIGLIFTSFQLSAQNSVGIGTNTPNTNSVLELVSTGNNQGFLMPRMTTVQRTDATFTSGLTTTENGLMVFDTDEGAVYFWYNGSWVNTTTLLAGTGIQITGNTIENIGDTDATDDITTATVAAGDVTGDFANLSVAGIQGQPVSNTVPTLDYVLKWDGSQWLPQPDAGNVYTAGTGIDVTGTVITNTGDTDATDDLTTASTAAGDVSGDFSTLQVTGIQGNAVDAGAPATGNILKWDGTQWLLSADNDAQDAASVPFDDAVAVLGATDVQAAIEALDAAIDGLSTGDMTQATYDTDANGIVDFAEDANTINGGLTVDTAVPVGADFTDDQTATDVPVTATGNLTSTDVQSALVELQTDIDGATGDMAQATYDVDANGTVDLAEDANTVNGGLTVDTAVPVGADFTDDQTATDVPVTATGNLTSTDVQSALVELQTDIDGAAGDMTQATYDVGSNGIVDNAELVNGLTVLTAVPAGAVFTDNELPGTAATGEILEWNGVAWVAAPNSSFTISDGTTILGDGDITPLSVGAVAPSLLTAGGATTGQILEYDGANWVPVAPSFVATTDGTSILGDGDITPLSVGAVAPSLLTAGGATTGQILEYDGLNWIPVTQSTATVSDGTSILGDGDITPLSVGAVAPSVITAGGATTGQILEYDGLNWIPVTQSTATVSDGTSILGDGDITPLSVGAVAPSVITAGGATTGQILEYDGLNWIPVTQSTATVSDGTSILGDGDITPLSVGAVAPSVITAGGATTGQILEYDGLNWIPVAQSTATVSDGTSILGDGDITPLSVGAVAPSVITAGGATTGQILEYDG
ncbi:MAG: hypothetical protein NXI20_02540, partial [bacterium]|nr:hypothetical protein [bacterium]